MSHVNHQQGSIVVLLLVLLALMALTPIVRGGGMKDPAATVRQKNVASLAQAREALLNYLLIGASANLNWTTLKANSGSIHARFPCPDIDGNGLINAVDTALCGAQGQSVLGLFPWGELGMPPLIDGSSNCLWYAVSGRYKLQNPTAGINGDGGGGSFTIVDGQFRTVATGVVAVIIAPGAALSWQNRAGAGANVPCPVPGGNAQSAASLYLDSTANPAGGVPVDHAALVTSISSAAFFMVSGLSDAPVEGGTMNDQITWITAEEYALAATRHAAEMEKAAWAPVLKTFHDGTTDPNDLTYSIHIYPPPAAEPGGACGRRNLFISGFLPMSCTLKDWWEDYEWWEERLLTCGTWYPWGNDPDDWGTFWVSRFYHYGYNTDELIDGEWTQVWHPGYWDYADRANKRAELNCNRWDQLNAWKQSHQVDMGSLPAITTALANDKWLRQTLYTYTVGGATLDGVTQTAPLILLRSRPMGSQLSPLANPSCLVAATVTPTVAMVSACLEAPNQAAFNGNRQFSNPNPRISNDLIRVMEREQQK